MAEEAVSPPVAGGGGRARLVIGGLALVAAVVLVRFLPVTDWLLAFVAWVQGAGTAGMAGFVAAYVAACVFFLPAFLLTLGAGFVYGVVTGSVLVWLSASLGATVAFLLGRTVARDAIARQVRTNARFASIDRAVGREGLKIVFLTRLSPAFPFVLLNYAYGLTTVSLRDYVIGKDLSVPTGSFAIRNLANPAATRNPDHYSNRIIGADEHFNATIPGHAYFLAIERM